jgi:hypothetical protein
VGRREQLLHELEEALEERDVAQERFQTSIGTSSEMHAYQRVRRASRRVAAADRAVRHLTVDETEFLHV